MTVDEALARIGDSLQVLGSLHIENEGEVLFNGSARFGEDFACLQAVKEEMARLERRVEQLECPDEMCHPDQPHSHIIAGLQVELEEVTKQRNVRENSLRMTDKKMNDYRDALGWLVNRFARFYYLAEHGDLGTLRDEMDRSAGAALRKGEAGE